MTNELLSEWWNMTKAERALPNSAQWKKWRENKQNKIIKIQK